MRDVAGGGVGDRVHVDLGRVGDRGPGHAYLIARRRDPGWIAAYVVGLLYLATCVAYVTTMAVIR